MLRLNPGDAKMDVVALALAMVLSLSVGLAGARGALGLMMYLLEASDRIPDSPPSVVPARATGGVQPTV
jgi:hypothetical protein